MKIRLMIALVVLALVFGTFVIACDDGELQKITPGDKEYIVDTTLVPYLDKDGNLQNPNLIADTTTNTPPASLEDLYPSGPSGP